MLQKRLESAGYDVRHGEDGNRALDLIRKDPPALVDGFEAIVPAAPQPAPKPPLPSGQSVVIGGPELPVKSSGAEVSDGMAYGIPAVTDGGHIRRLGDVEADMIRLALHRYRGQMSQVARKLGIGRSTLYRKMRDLGLDAKAQ